MIWIVTAVEFNGLQKSEPTRPATSRDPVLKGGSKIRTRTCPATSAGGLRHVVARGRASVMVCARGSCGQTPAR
jgi:hypothetical protein